MKLLISSDPATRLNKKLKELEKKERSEYQIFEMKNEIFIAYLDDVAREDIIRAIRDNVIGDQLQKELVGHLNRLKMLEVAM